MVLVLIRKKKFNRKLRTHVVREILSVLSIRPFSKSVQNQPFLERVLAKIFRHYLPKINQHMYLVQNKIFCSVPIHIVFVMFTVFTFFGYRFQYLKENLCDDFCSGASLFSLPFQTFTVACLGVHLYNTVHKQMMLLFFLVGAHSFHTSEVFISYKNGKGLGQ